MEVELSEENTFNILIATDNHLGYKERDPIRGKDSFKTFEEILLIANDRKVDFILLGGDLFHENKPSQYCVHKCMALLRQYCMGNTPVQFEFVSDQSVNFKHNKFPVVNYEDPNLNISIPVFSIHGNHDDPTGSKSRSALDLLSVSGLVNYFGKYVDLQNIQISPLLLQKGATKLALYGLGSIRDEILYGLFKEGNVSMLRPQADTEDWFNMFVIHQNRTQYGLGKTNYIPSNFLDDFLNLVIWGHEHKCRLTPEEDDRGFQISQPGSSVATSMKRGEAVPNTKCVGLLQVNKKKYSMEKIQLQTVRPFYFEEINLRESGLDSNLPDYTERIKIYCKGRVDALLAKAQCDGIDKQQPELPLIRLRVDHTDTSETFNTYRFGQQFLDKVANPKDIIKFHKKGELKNKNITLGADGMNKIQVEDLVTDYFKSPEHKLSLLTERDLLYALNEYVQKEDKHAMESLVKLTMEKAIKESIDPEITNFAKRRNEDPDEIELPGATRGKATRGRGGRSQKKGIKRKRNEHTGQ